MIDFIFAHVVALNAFICLVCSVIVTLKTETAVAAPAQVSVFALRPVDAAVVVRSKGVVAGVNSHFVDEAVIILMLGEIEALIFRRQRRIRFNLGDVFVKRRFLRRRFNRRR